MNDEAQAGMHTDPATGGANPSFAQAYAAVVLRLKEINDSVQARLVELDRGPGTAAGAAAAAAAGMYAADDAAAAPSCLPPELQALGGAITAQALAAAARGESRRVVAACRALREAAAEGEGEGGGGGEAGAGAGAAVDWAAPEGAQLGGVIEGAVWALVLLQQGGDAAVPPQALAAALDGSLRAVRPRAAANALLFAEIEVAMAGLKAQLLGAPG
jgi:hypothetical protein